MIYYQPNAITAVGSTKGYHIQLSSAHHNLARFGATKYATGSEAANAAKANRYQQWPSGTRDGTLSLGSQLTGAVTVQKNPSPGGDAMSGGQWAAVSWQEGRWETP